MTPGVTQGIDWKGNIPEQQKQYQSCHDAALETLLHICCSTSIVIKEKLRARMETRFDT
jgi:hypothetical protein